METSSRASDVALYEDDFYGWTQHQAELIRTGRVHEADLAHIVEEIETLGRSERDALESAYRLICLHQLKRMFQPEKQTASWAHTIVRERLHAARLLKNNPGLKPHRQALFSSAYQDGRKEAAAETGIVPGLFPAEPPFGLDQLADEDFWAVPPK